MKAQVLLVEDDDLLRDSLKRVLQSEDFAVVTGGNNQQNQQILHEQHVDMVLIDVDSTDRNGWDEAQRIAASLMFLPMIVITAMSGQQHRAAMTGADVLMEKPLNFPDLLQSMRRLLEQTLEGRLYRIEQAYGHAAA